jgi:hypothetical protein
MYFFMNMGALQRPGRVYALPHVVLSAFICSCHMKDLCSLMTKRSDQQITELPSLLGALQW